VDSEEELRTLLERLRPTEERPLICEEFVEGRQCTLEVVTIGGIPAWFSATRAESQLLSAGLALTITLPREQDDPADPLLRRMGFAALKALGMDTGISSMSWLRRPDGTPIISNVTAHPPVGHIVALMGLAHGADMYRAWGNAVVNGLFAPIPRLYAAGAGYFRAQSDGSTISAVHGLDEIVQELGDIVVQVQAPQVGQASSNALGGDGFILVRHAETAVVDDALKRIADTVQVTLGA
jgi:hypothetical protein